MRPRHPSSRRGLSLIETVISAAILAGLMAAVLSAAGTTAARRRAAADARTAQALADELASETALLSFDPVANILGSPTRREMFNDLLDAHGWSESPPASIDGIPNTALAGWSSSIAVQWVSPSAPRTAVAFDTGCRRITVTVSRGGQTMTTAIRLITRVAREAGL